MNIEKMLDDLEVKRQALVEDEYRWSEHASSLSGNHIKRDIHFTRQDIQAIGMTMRVFLSLLNRAVNLLWAILAVQLIALIFK